MIIKALPLVLVIVIITSCGKHLLQPSVEIIVGRTEFTAQILTDLGENIASEYAMVVGSRGQTDSVESYGTFFEATGNSWLYRSFAIGRPNAGWIRIAQSGEIYKIFLAHPKRSGVTELISSWEKHISERTTDYQIKILQ